MVFLWILSCNKSPQVSRTLLSILADLNNAVDCMFSTCPIVSKFLSSFYQSFGDCTKSIIYNWYHRQLHVPKFFVYSLARSKTLSFFSLSFNFTLWASKSAIMQIIFFVDYYKICTSGRDYVIRLYLRIPEELVCLILLDRFWVAHIPFACMIKFQFLALIPVNHFAH